MTPQQAARKLGNITQNIVDEVTQELKNAQNEAYGDAVRLSSKPRGTGKRPGYDGVGVDTGEFRSKWYRGQPYKDGAGDMHAPVTNTSAKASFWQGIGKTVANNAKKGFFKRISDAVERGLR